MNFVNKKVRLIFSQLAFFTFLGLAVFFQPVKVFAQGANVLTVSSSSITVGQKVTFNVSNLTPNATISLYLTKKEDGTTLNSIFYTNSSNNIVDAGGKAIDLSFNAASNGVGNWSGYANVAPPGDDTNTVQWQVTAASGGQMICLSASQQQVDCNTGSPAYCNVNGAQVACPLPADAGPSKYELCRLADSQSICCQKFPTDIACTSSGSTVTPGTAGGNCPCGQGLFCDISVNPPICKDSGSGGPSGPGSVPPANPSTSGAGTCPPPLKQVNGICLPDNTNTGFAGTKTLTDLIYKVIEILLIFAGSIAVIILIIGGFWYITSAGNEEQAEKGKKAIINAIIGLVAIIMSYAIVKIIESVVTGTTTGKL